MNVEEVRHRQGQCRRDPKGHRRYPSGLSPKPSPVKIMGATYENEGHEEKKAPVRAQQLTVGRQTGGQAGAPAQ